MDVNMVAKVLGVWLAHLISDPLCLHNVSESAPQSHQQRLRGIELVRWRRWYSSDGAPLPCLLQLWRGSFPPNQLAERAMLGELGGHSDRDYLGHVTTLVSFPPKQFKREPFVACQVRWTCSKFTASPLAFLPGRSLAALGARCGRGNSITGVASSAIFLVIIAFFVLISFVLLDFRGTGRRVASPAFCASQYCLIQLRFQCLHLQLVVISTAQLKRCTTATHRGNQLVVFFAKHGQFLLVCSSRRCLLF